MIHHIWTVVCRNCLVDKDTNTISLIEVIEEVAVVADILSRPTPPPRQLANMSMPIFNVVSYWCRERDETPEKGRARLRVINPTGEAHLIGENEVDLTEFTRLRHVNKLLGLPGSSPGKYQFEISRLEGDNWVPVFHLPFWIQLPSPPEPAAQPANSSPG